MGVSITSEHATVQQRTYSHGPCRARDESGPHQWPRPHLQLRPSRVRFCAHGQADRKRVLCRISARSKDRWPDSSRIIKNLIGRRHESGSCPHTVPHRNLDCPIDEDSVGRPKPRQYHSLIEAGRTLLTHVVREFHMRVVANVNLHLFPGTGLVANPLAPGTHWQEMAHNTDHLS